MSQAKQILWLFVEKNDFQNRQWKVHNVHKMPEHTFTRQNCKIFLDD